MQSSCAYDKELAVPMTRQKFNKAAYYTADADKWYHCQ